MNPGIKKFFIKISRFKSDAASIIGLRLSFVISFFVCLLVLAILSFSFRYDRVQLIPKTTDISNASLIANLNIFNRILNSEEFLNAETRNEIHMVEILNQEFNRDIIKFIFIKYQDNMTLYEDLPEGFAIENAPSARGNIKNQDSNQWRVVTQDSSGKYIALIPTCYQLGDFFIYMGFNTNYEIQKDLNEMMNEYSIWFIIMVLVLTFLVTYFVSILILSPIERLRAVASKFAEGDLSDRVDSTYFTEINDLIKSYNTMADVLQKLYSSLEAEVSARTKELKAAYSELQSTQAMMVHSEKMKSLGELVAGIMHEINNPINFIYGNMTHLDNYSKDLVKIVDEYSDLDKELSPELQKKYKALKDELDYDFIKSDIPDLIKSCKEGAERAKNIIQDLKSFSRFEESAISNINIEKEVDTCLTILYNKYKNRITIHKEFPENMPTIEAYGGQLNQVFMNILDNAIGAIEGNGDIWIRALFTNNNVRVEIEDNGSGMSEETKQKVFNPFFTTKPVGQGTGLGMSITYKVIKNHNGDIEIETQQGIGTKFIITLPLSIDRELMKSEKSEEV